MCYCFWPLALDLYVSFGGLSNSFGVSSLFVVVVFVTCHKLRGGRFRCINIIISPHPQPNGCAQNEYSNNNDEKDADVRVVRVVVHGINVRVDMAMSRVESHDWWRADTAWHLLLRVLVFMLGRYKNRASIYPCLLCV